MTRNELSNFIVIASEFGSKIGNTFITDMMAKYATMITDNFKDNFLISARVQNILCAYGGYHEYTNPNSGL